MDYLFSLPHIKGITLGAGEKIYEVAERASIKGLVIDRASGAQTARICRTDLAAGFLAGIGAKDRSRGWF